MIRLCMILVIHDDVVASIVHCHALAFHHIIATCVHTSTLRHWWEEVECAQQRQRQRLVKAALDIRPRSCWLITACFHLCPIRRNLEPSVDGVASSKCPHFAPLRAFPISQQSYDELSSGNAMTMAQKIPKFEVSWWMATLLKCLIVGQILKILN